MISIFVNQNGRTDTVDRVEPAWLDPASSAKVWVDLAGPTPEELAVLSDVFHFHPLAIEHALLDTHRLQEVGNRVCDARHRFLSGPHVPGDRPRR